jgi:hypothetical protein
MFYTSPTLPDPSENDRVMIDERLTEWGVRTTKANGSRQIPPQPDFRHYPRADPLE